MAKNDRLLLDGILDDRVAIKLPSEKRDEAFEYLAYEQLLKEFDLSTDEILFGSVDGRQDGGIDGFFIFVNGHLLQDPESFQWPKTGSELRVFLISSKHHDTFKQAAIDGIIATLSELLDFSVDDSLLKGAYSEVLLKMRNNLKLAYRKLSPRLSSFSVDVFYASRGDTSEIGEEVAARGNQVALLIRESFGSCGSRFSFIGATELVDLHRKIPNYTLELPFVEALAKGERYIVLAKLSDYYKFISDDGVLRRYLYDSNVRDFIGLNRVNEDIRTTLNDVNSPDFWWLNNGVTILSTSAAITGKSIQASDIQIVNGLQTTESIFRYFSSCPNSDDDRCVLVKLIVTKDEYVRDSIIKATNNQTDVEIASLHATDKIQRDIEDVMVRHGLYYERRKNYYANQGRAPSELVTPLYIAAGYVALILKRPHEASVLRSRFMRNAHSYELVFDDKAPLEVWPHITLILKKVDFELEKLRSHAKVTDGFLKKWRYLVAFLVLAEHYRRFMYSSMDLVNFDVLLINSESVIPIWNDLNDLLNENNKIKSWSSRKYVLDAFMKLAQRKDISDINGLRLVDSRVERPSSKSLLTPEFVEEVRNLLPPQPWKPGMHKAILEKLKCGSVIYSAAVDQLTEEGLFFKQKDGVLYDNEGNVVGFDSERVSSDSLKLIL